MSADTLYPIEGSILCYHNTSNPGDQRHIHLPYHRHDAYEIYLFLNGNAKLYIEQYCCQLLSGDLFLISPAQLHRSVCLDEQSYDRIIVNIKAEALKLLSSKKTDLLACFDTSREAVRHIRLCGEYLTEYQTLTNQLCHYRERTDYGSDIMADAYLAQLLVFINQCFLHPACTEERNIMPGLISQVMEYICAHLTEPLSLSHLSQQFYMSGTYISSQFKRHTGLTLRTYILDQRIAMAKKLLTNGCNVSEACYQSGFSDYSNFIRSFTRLTGMSPGKYSKYTPG